MRVHIDFTPQSLAAYRRRRFGEVPMANLCLAAEKLLEYGKLIGDSTNGTTHVAVDVPVLRGLVAMAKRFMERNGHPTNGKGKPNLATAVPAKRAVVAAEPPKPIPDKPASSVDTERAQRAIWSAARTLKFAKRYNQEVDFGEAEQLLAEARELEQADPDSSFFTARDAEKAAEKTVLGVLAEEIQRKAMAANTELAVDWRIRKAIGLPYYCGALNELLDLRREINREIEREEVSVVVEFGKRSSRRQQTKFSGGHRHRTARSRREPLDGVGAAKRPPHVSEVINPAQGFFVINNRLVKIAPYLWRHPNRK